jgi:Ras-related protein Rab-8A
VRFSQDNKKAKVESHMPTIGIDFKIKRVVLDGNKVKLQIWDTAGQERFRTMTTSYYRGSQGILLVYDITDKKSFTAIRSWIAQIKQVFLYSKIHVYFFLISEKVVIRSKHSDANVNMILVGNKCDRQDDRVYYSIVLL